jgi:VanZ family protein
VPDKKGRRFVPSIAWALILLVVSITPGGDMPAMNVSDKAAHVLFYFIQTILLARALVKNHTMDWVNRAYLISAVTVFSFGIALEIIQELFISGRTGDWWDIAANAVGIGLAYPFHRFTCRKID